MSRPIDPKLWEEIKQEYVNGSDSYAALALKHSISKASVENRASKEGWNALRKARTETQSRRGVSPGEASPGEPPWVDPQPDVLATSKSESHPKTIRVSEAPAPKVVAVLPRSKSRRPSAVLDDLEILDDAIAVLSGSLRDTEPKSTEGVASSLAKIVETRRKLYPLTAEDLADLALVGGISPQEFIRSLSSKWQQQA